MSTPTQVSRAFPANGSLHVLTEPVADDVLHMVDQSCRVLVPAGPELCMCVLKHVKPAALARLTRDKK